MFCCSQADTALGVIDRVITKSEAYTHVHGLALFAFSIDSVCLPNTTHANYVQELRSIRSTFWRTTKLATLFTITGTRLRFVSIIAQVNHCSIFSVVQRETAFDQRRRTDFTSQGSSGCVFLPCARDRVLTFIFMLDQDWGQRRVGAARGMCVSISFCLGPGLVH